MPKTPSKCGGEGGGGEDGGEGGGGWGGGTRLLLSVVRRGRRRVACRRCARAGCAYDKGLMKNERSRACELAIFAGWRDLNIV